MLRKLACLAAAALLALACSKATPETTETSGAPLTELSVKEVADLVKAKKATVVDANNVDTRKEYGVVPGAVLLSSSKDFAVSELPAEKSTKLVFYCGGTACKASDKAAHRAASAGYADVSVMREGIRGWKSAGQPTSSHPQS